MVHATLSEQSLQDWLIFCVAGLPVRGERRGPLWGHPRRAEEHSVAFYPYCLDGVAAEPTLNRAGGIHPNAGGAEAIVERMLPHLVALIGAPDSRS